jgi:phospholipase/lecithinase/hemolysin
MTIQKWAKGFVLTAAALTASASAFAQYSKVVVFGDSMSDTHRFHDFMKLATGRDYPSPPSMPWRFSNGHVAVEVLAENLNAPIQIYAFSGAQSGYGTLLAIPLGVLSQVNEYLNNNAIVPSIETVPLVSSITTLVPGTGRTDPKALHLIWTGPDDYYGVGGYNALTAYIITANIQQAITSLYDAGARYFFVPGMPDLSLTPSARYNHEPKHPGYMATAAKYSAQFSVVLAKGLDAMRVKYPKARIMSYDTLSFMKVEMDKARAQGKNVTEACYPGVLDTTGARIVCSDPDNYMFWDTNHPTALANKILGDEWSKAIVYKP